MIPYFAVSHADTAVIAPNYPPEAAIDTVSAVIVRGWAAAEWAGLKFHSQGVPFRKIDMRHNVDSEAVVSRDVAGNCDAISSRGISIGYTFRLRDPPKQHIVFALAAILAGEGVEPSLTFVSDQSTVPGF